MIWNGLARYRDLGLLLLRLGVGLGFIYFHGWAKLSGGPERWAGIGSAVELFGIGFGHTLFGFLAAFSESVGGLLIALGLFFRPAAALLLTTMIVATTRHIVTGQGTPAHAFKNAWVFLGILFVGPGKYSVDDWWRRRRTP
jgi:putative oxidoreductase